MSRDGNTEISGFSWTLVGAHELLADGTEVLVDLCSVPNPFVFVKFGSCVCLFVWPWGGEASEGVARLRPVLRRIMSIQHINFIDFEHFS